VGKVLLVYRSTSLVLLINDHSSGVGAILEKSRTQGIVRGTPAGEVVLEKVMSDETVPVGEQVLTSGGDSIFPKGLLIGRVTKVVPGSELFLNIRVSPAADLSKLEEVLVVTKIDERQAQPDQTGAARAVDILAERLPTVPPKPENAEKAAAPGTVTPGTVTPSNVTPSNVAPKTAPKTLPPAIAGSEAKPKAVPSDASASGGTTAVRKPATSASTNSYGISAGSPSGAASATKPITAGSDATKVSKPVKVTVEPKPQPVVEDAPH
jgi:rod shape-determining protein MreC